MATAPRDHHTTSLHRMGPYEVELTRKRIRRAYLRVDVPRPRVRVSAPHRMPLAQIEEFVLKHGGWIDSRHDALERAVPASARRGHVDADGSVLLWGRRVPLEGVSPRGAKLFATSKGKALDEALKRDLARLLVADAGPLVQRYEPVMGVEVKELRTKDMQTRWGTCNARDARIWLATSLVHFPKECLELIVVHEMCHLLERGHGPRFKALMDRHLPDWRSRDALLKELARNR